MEYRILGPLEVLRDSLPVPIPGRHQPRLLAVLLLEAGRTVTISRLAESLWEENPPATARRQVRNLMAALRRTLGAGVVETAGEGYRLVIRESEVDSLRFDRLLLEARDDAAQGRHVQSLAKFTEGLALWRGSPLSGLSGRIIESAATRLEEKRRSAVEERAEVKLALGRHTEVVDELAELMERQPFRQRAAGSLMQALYRCGRNAEAVEVYMRLRTRLSTELGIDPDPAVTEVHERIRREDPTLGGPKPEPGIASSADVPTPAQLPADVGTFTGRAEHLAALDRMLDQEHAGAVVSAISGGGGVGKTALAIHWGQKRRDRFPDGQLYINLRGFDLGEPIDAGSTLSRFLRALGIPAEQIPSDTETAAALFRKTLDRRRVLIVLDNARTIEQVRPLLSHGPNSFVLVTSRNQPAGLANLDNISTIELDGLSPAESLDLLGALCGSDRLHAEPASARRLARLCGYLPLALRIAAANLAARPECSLAEFVSELDGLHRLDLLNVGDDPRSAVAATFELSLGALSADARDLFMRLGTIPGDDVPKGLVFAVSELPEPPTENALRDLVAAHLIEAPVPGRYRLHDLVKLFAGQRADETLESAVTTEVQSALIDWYLDNHRSFGIADMSNAIATCEALNDHPKQWGVARALIMAPELGANTRIALQHCETALRLTEEHDDRYGQAQMLSTLGAIHDAIGKPESAISLCRQAVDIARNNTDPLTFSAMGNGLGIQLLKNGHCVEAEAVLLEVLRIVESIDDFRAMHIRMINLGNVYRVLGRYGEAEHYLDRSIELSDHAPRIYSTLASLITRASVHIDLGQHERGSSMADEVLVLARQNGSPRHSIIALQQLGRAESGRGNIAHARDFFQTSIDLAKRHGMPGPEREGVDLLIELESDSGDHVRSEELLLRKESIPAEQIGPVEFADDLRLECMILARTGHYRRAIQSGEKAADMFATMPYPLMQARTLTILAEAQDGLGHHSQADEHRREALTIFTRLGVPEAEVLRANLDARPR